MRFLLTLSLMFLVLMLTPLATEYTIEYCNNATTLVTETMSDAGGSNVTTSYEFENCVFGCDNSTGGVNTCYSPTEELDYGLIITIGIGIIIIICIVLMIYMSKENSIFKMLFLFVALFLMYFSLTNIGIIGENYSGIISNASNSILTVALAFGWIIFLMLAWFGLMIIVNAIRGLTNGKE